MSDDIKILKALPVLQKISNTQTLSDYFKETVAPLREIQDNPEKKILTNAIFQQTERLYGADVAKEVCEQVNRFPVVETGTHLALLRDYDTPKKDDLRSRLNQNVLISSALMRHMGQKYHVGVYGSNVNLNHPCGGGFFQLGDDIFPVAQLRQINQNCLYDAPSIDKNYFNEALPLVAKLNMLNSVLTNEAIDKTQSPQKEMLQKTKKVITRLLEPVSQGKMAYSIVQKQYQTLNENNQNAIKTAMLLLSADAYKKYGYTFSDVDKQYLQLQEVFNRQDLKLPDQVALIQSNTINKVLQGSDIKHISVDAVEVARQFLISSLENKNSLWYNIFNNSEKFNKMHQSFIGIRGSWKANESVFDYVARDKGFSKTKTLPLEALDHKPETLLPLLKDRKIIPSSALLILLFQSASVMAHGGFFQTTYADKIKKRFVNYLSDIGEVKRSEQLQKLPVDMALLSLAILKDKTGQPMKLSDISRMSEDKRKQVINEIPTYPSHQAVSNALPVLGKYLDATAPGYVESEARYADVPQLISQHKNTSNIFSQTQKLERSA